MASRTCAKLLLSNLFYYCGWFPRKYSRVERRKIFRITTLCKRTACIATDAVVVVFFFGGGGGAEEGKREERGDSRNIEATTLETVHLKNLFAAPFSGFLFFPFQ